MQAPGILEALGLYLARAGALVLASPLLGTGASFAGYKVGLTAALAFLLYAVGGEPLATAPEPLEYAVLVMREILIGLALAFVLQVVVLAVRVASELIGHEMAFTMSNVVDPASGVNIPLIGHLYELLFFLGLLAVDGHHWVLRALARSCERAPVGVLDLRPDIPVVALDLFAQLFAAGITFAAPIMVLLAMVSVLIGLLTRAVPQINVLEFGFNLRIAVGLVGMFLFAPLLAPAIDELMRRLMHGLDASLGAIGA